MSVDRSESGAGLGVRQSPGARADVEVGADASLSQLHQALVDGLDDAIVAALRDCPGADRRDHADALREAGVDALDGRLASALGKLAEATDRDADAAPRDAYHRARSLLDRLGTDKGSGLDDVRAALPPLLAATSAPDATPVVSVRLGVGWPTRRKQQRSDVLRYLSTLAMGVDLRLVVADAASVRILEDHVADVPTWLLTELRDRRQRGSAPAAEERADVVDDALGSLSRSGRPAGVLRALSASVTDALDYDALARSLVLDGAPYQAVSRLADMGLVETREAADGRTVVSLLPAGAEVGDVLATERRRESGRSSASAAGPASASSGGSEPDHKPPQNHPAMPCWPAGWDGPPGPDAGPAAEADERPREDAEAAAGDRLDRYREGWVWPRYGDRTEWLPPLESADVGEVALVDADLGPRLEPDRDGRQAHVSFVEDDDAIVVGAEYHNPMQFAVAIASGLLSERLLATDDWTDRIGRGLHGLDIAEKPVLWGARCMGWLPAEVETGEDYIGELRDASEDIRDMSGLANAEESAVTRGSTTRMALGFIGTVVALFDLLDVDVVLEARVPHCSRHYGERGNPKNREDLLKHLATLSTLCSRVGAFSAFRQLFEDRERKRSDAFSPGFGTGESACTGSMNAGIVVCGDGVDGLADDLADELEEPRPLHEEAPPLAVDVDVVEDVRGDRMRGVVSRMLDSRGIRSTRGAESVMSAFARSPYGAAEAIDVALKTESNRRDVYLDEIRRSLATLDAGRLLPGESYGARDGVAALLAADRPLSQSELAERADISPQTWRNHRDSLVAIDVVREVEDGWRVALPFRDERNEDVDVADPPWYLRTESRRPGDRWRTRKPTDVLDWALPLWGDPTEKTDPETRVGQAFTAVEDGILIRPAGNVDVEIVEAALAEMGLPPDILLAGCGGAERPPPTSTARMGRSTRQTSLV